jgi:hypothetical protein
MTDSKLTLSILPEILAICRLKKNAGIPEWAQGARFVSITRTSEELSVVCPQTQVPKGTKRDAGWRCLKVKGPLDLSATGVLASLTAPLAQERISVFAFSTYDTDYFLVRQKDLKKAAMVLSQSGHQMQFPPQSTQRGTAATKRMTPG